MQKKENSQNSVAFLNSRKLASLYEIQKIICFSYPKYFLQKEGKCAICVLFFCCTIYARIKLVLR